jgi:hypothetical protein
MCNPKHFKGTITRAHILCMRVGSFSFGVTDTELFKIVYLKRTGLIYHFGFYWIWPFERYTPFISSGFEKEPAASTSFISSFLHLKIARLYRYGLTYLACEFLVLLLLIAQWLAFYFIFGPSLLSASGIHDIFERLFPLVCISAQS